VPPSAALTIAWSCWGSRKKSTWFAYSFWTTPHENSPAFKRFGSRKMSPGVDSSTTTGAMWIVICSGTRLQLNELAFSAARTCCCW